MSHDLDQLNSEARVSIRAARSGDEAAILRLAQLDGHPELDTSRLLVAELDGELLAALPLGGGKTIADPFQPTAALVEMLELRAGQLRDGPARRRGLRARLSRIRPGATRRPAMAPATPANAGMLITRD